MTKTGTTRKSLSRTDTYCLIRTRCARSACGGGLEVADALGPSGQFVCVKKAERSTAPLNHLFAQGRVAIETLRYDREARESSSPSFTNSPQAIRWTRLSRHR